MDARYVPAIFEREALRIVFLVKIPKIVIGDRLVRQIAVQEGAELLPARIRPHRQKHDSQALCERSGVMGEQAQRFIRRKAVISPIEPVQIDLAFLVDKAPQKSLALRVVARRRQQLRFAALRDVVMNEIAHANERVIDRISETLGYG